MDIQTKYQISNEKFKSNWHLSSSRAINIVKLLIENGISSNRLVAAGFGEHSHLLMRIVRMLTKRIEE